MKANNTPLPYRKGDRVHFRRPDGKVGTGYVRAIHGVKIEDADFRNVTIESLTDELWTIPVDDVALAGVKCTVCDGPGHSAEVCPWGTGLES